MTPEALPDEAEALGIELVADGPWLRVRPKFLLTRDLVRELRSNKAEILALVSLRAWPRVSTGPRS